MISNSTLDTHSPIELCFQSVLIRVLLNSCFFLKSVCEFISLKLLWSLL